MAEDETQEPDLTEIRRTSERQSPAVVGWAANPARSVGRGPAWYTGGPGEMEARKIIRNSRSPSAMY